MPSPGAQFLFDTLLVAFFSVSVRALSLLVT
jgi:hypothetical protein